VKTIVGIPITKKRQSKRPWEEEGEWKKDEVHPETVEKWD